MIGSRPRELRMAQKAQSKSIDIRLSHRQCLSLCPIDLNPIRVIYASQLIGYEDAAAFICSLGIDSFLFERQSYLKERSQATFTGFAGDLYRPRAPSH